jgi:hypothetical protein
MNGSNGQKDVMVRHVLLTVGMWVGGAITLGLLVGGVMALVPWHWLFSTPAAEVQTASVVHGQTVAAVQTAPVQTPSVQTASTQTASVQTAAAEAARIPVSQMVQPARVATSARSVHGRRVAHRRRHRRHRGLRKAKPALAAALVETVPFGYRVEGDATVVEYDARRGRVYTSEGAEFVLTGTGSPELGRGYAPHLHYHCDMAGACTVGWSGLVFRDARLAP